jgi:hypothetical protein
MFIFFHSQENRKLVQQCSLDKRALVRLREDTVEEKIKCDNLSGQLENIQRQLKKIGIDQNALDGEGELEIISNE